MEISSILLDIDFAHQFHVLATANQITVAAMHHRYDVSTQIHIRGSGNGANQVWQLEVRVNKLLSVLVYEWQEAQTTHFPRLRRNSTSSHKEH